jgi:tight adherence protein B
VQASPAFEARRRLRKFAHETDERVPADLKIEILVEMSRFDKFLYKFGLIRRLDGLIDKAGLKIEVKIFFLVLLAVAAAGFIIGIPLKRGWLPSVVFMLICGSVPFIYLQIKKTRRIQRFTDQFSGALDMIARALKAGHSLISAIQTVGNDMAEPVAGLFRTVYEEQSLGLSMKDAFAHMVERMDTTDLRFFVTAVNIYREIGGNLSEILERLAQTIRERTKIRRQVQVYTAQARLSGYILGALPFLVALFFFIADPEYIGELFSVQIGRYLVAAALALQLIGFLAIRKIINIRI